jgi:uncharacterized protein YdhG (YjbR/CyaY superfamily)
MEAVDEYISKQPPLQKEILNKIRELVRKIAPSADQTLGYGVPSFKFDNGQKFYYAAFKEHVSIFPEPAVIKMFEKELRGYETSKGTIKFFLDKPIPYDLIRKMVGYKIAS